MKFAALLLNGHYRQALVHDDLLHALPPAPTRWNCWPPIPAKMKC
jgi:hypothetical protein